MVTLDGVMQAQGGPDEHRSNGFAHGGWVWPFWNDAAGRHVVDIFNRDEFSLLVFPVLIGTGKRLFGDGTVPASLALADTRTFESGVVPARYRRAAALARLSN